MGQEINARKLQLAARRVGELERQLDKVTGGGGVERGDALRVAEAYLESIVEAAKDLYAVACPEKGYVVHSSLDGVLRPTSECGIPGGRVELAPELMTYEQWEARREAEARRRYEERLKSAVAHEAERRALNLATDAQDQAERIRAAEERGFYQGRNQAWRLLMETQARYPDTIKVSKAFLADLQRAILYMNKEG